MIRDAARDDVPAVAGLERELFGRDAWSAATVTEELTGAGRVAVVACDDARAVVGYAVVLLGPDVLDLQRIGVAAARRRTGLGRRLLSEALTRAAGRGGDRVLLEVSAGNDGARAFYEALGFEEIARRARYYRDGADALVLAAQAEVLRERSQA